MSERFRIYHVRNNALVKKYLFDIGVTTTEANGSFNSGSQSSSVSGACTLLCSNSSGRMTECPPGVPTLTNENEGALSLHDDGMGSLFDFASAQIGDRLYLGRWDANHSYIVISNKTQNVTPGNRGDYDLELSYFTSDDELVYTASWHCQWMASRNVIYLGSLPWLWKWNNPSSFTLTRIEIYNYYNSNVPYFCNGFVGGITPTTMALGRKFWQNVPIIDTGNPYEPGGTSTEGDPTPGNFSDDSQDLDPEGLPDEGSTGAVGTGFATIFTPTKSQLNHLADVMWGNDIVSFLQNQVENIKDMFVSLGIVPFRVTPGATVSVMWLGIVDTAISLTKAANQFYEFNMGSINMATSEYVYSSKSALDYSPFSKLGIYLPFIGYQELDIDECRESIIGLKYKIDILSGSCVAQISLNGNPVYQFAGNCMTQIPLTGQDAQTLFTNAVNVGIAAAGAKSAGAVASAGDAATDAMVDSGKIGAESGEAQHAQHAAHVSNARGSLASATANGMMGMKPSYSKAGAISASNSLLALKQPFLFLTTPRQCIPEHYQRYCGFPSNITGKLGDFSGYTVVEDIRLNGLVATSSEVEEIYQLLKSGVII